MTELKAKFLELAKVWERITEIFKNEVADYPHTKMSPEEFVKRLLKEVEMDTLINVFGVVAIYKTYDGRIFDENRRFLANLMDPEIRAEVVRDYRVVCGPFTRIDDIHSTHIDQTITAIRRAVNARK